MTPRPDTSVDPGRSAQSSGRSFARCRLVRNCCMSATRRMSRRANHTWAKSCTSASPDRRSESSCMTDSPDRCAHSGRTRYHHTSALPDKFPDRRRSRRRTTRSADRWAHSSMSGRTDCTSDSPRTTRFQRTTDRRGMSDHDTGSARTFAPRRNWASAQAWAGNSDYPGNWIARKTSRMCRPDRCASHSSSAERIADHADTSTSRSGSDRQRARN